MKLTKRKYSEKEIYDAYLKERKDAYGGNLKIIENGAKELIKILRKIKNGNNNN